jgi:membrane protease YdiL (CAAX protease family)
METAVYRPPPSPPELPEGVDPTPRWPAWYALAGFALFLIATVIAQSILLGATGSEPGEADPVVTIVGTLVMETIAIGTAVLFASLTAKPQPWHFGLRSSRFWAAVGWAAAGWGCFWLFTIFYSLAVHPDIDQRVTESLGADQGTAGLITAGVVVVGLAPVAEEFFFRGFLYRALRGRFTIAVAAIIDGLLFGLVHYEPCDPDAAKCNAAEGLLLVPPLGVLGVVFCLVYERTGSLFPVIALHALNNALAFGVQADGWAVSAVVGPLVLAGCVLAPRLLGPGSRPIPALR